MADARLPTSDERTVIIGATGSGKTQFSVWLLSTRDWDNRPWVVLDFKGEKLFRELGLQEWDINDGVPVEPGVYWVPIIPGSDEEVSQFFYSAYMAGNVGIYIDEATMLPGNPPKYDRWIGACLTQGRAKNIEMITCTQRPANIDVKFFSEASFFGIFNLRLKADRKRVEEYTDGLEIGRLPQYHCLWYNVVNDSSVIFEPVPPAPILVEAFREELDEVEQERDETNGITTL